MAKVEGIGALAEKLGTALQKLLDESVTRTHLQLLLCNYAKLPRGFGNLRGEGLVGLLELPGKFILSAVQRHDHHTSTSESGGMVYTRDLKSLAFTGLVGSSPTSRTN